MVPKSYRWWLGFPISQGTGFYINTSALAIRTLISAKILEGRHPRYAHQSNDGSCLGHVASQCLLASDLCIRLPPRSLVLNGFELQPKQAETYCAVLKFCFSSTGESRHAPVRLCLRKTVELKQPRCKACSQSSGLDSCVSTLRHCNSPIPPGGNGLGKLTSPKGYFSGQESGCLASLPNLKPPPCLSRKLAVFKNWAFRLWQSLHPTVNWASSRKVPPTKKSTN